jgi:ABC-type multidrug transport system ATPase subunit
MGVITGDMLVDGHPRTASFQRKTGYVQQQDLHLETTTVREALNFSALLRQPAHASRKEKLAYVDEVIKLLGMEEYADAVVGVPGEGLNVEQRKRLTIGVELAAKPPLLVFVDEPTSGLDSQTSWAILDLLQKLTKVGRPSCVPSISLHLCFFSASIGCCCWPVAEELFTLATLAKTPST